MGTSYASRAGEAIAGYRLLEELGPRGRRSFVARRPSGATSAGARVAIEVFDESPALVASARALVRLRHANVMAVRDVVVEGRAAIVESDAVDGAWMADVIAAKPAPLGAALRVLVDVLEGLSALHGLRAPSGEPLGRVHGEVAPANVRLGSDGIARVARMVRAPEGEPSPDVLGYLAPEVLLRDQGIDARADVYGVGVLLWEALSGERLQTATTAGEIVVRLLGGKVPVATPPASAPWASGLALVAKRALAPELAVRYPSAAEMAGAIRREAGAHLGTRSDVTAWIAASGARSAASPPAPAARPTAPKAPPRASTPSAASPKPVPPRAPLLTPAPAIDVVDGASIDLASERPTAPPPPAPAGRLSIPTPIVPMSDVAAFARAALRSSPDRAEALAPPPVPAPAVAPPVVAPPVVEPVVDEVLDDAMIEVTLEPPPPEPPASIPSVPARATPVSAHADRTEMALAIAPAHPSSRAPRSRRRRAVVLVALLVALPALAEIAWLASSRRGEPPIAPRAAVATEPSPMAAPAIAPPVAEPAPPPVAEPEPAPTETAPLVASPPTASPGSSSGPPASPAPSSSAEPIAPAPLRKGRKSPYLPLGI